MFHCASEGNGINQISVRALSIGGKARCHMYRCRRVYILRLFSGFIAILLCVCVCVCVSERERELLPPNRCVHDFDSTCFRLVANVNSGK